MRFALLKPAARGQKPSKPATIDGTLERKEKYCSCVLPGETLFTTFGGNESWEGEKFEEVAAAKVNTVQT